MRNILYFIEKHVDLEKDLILEPSVTGLLS